MKIVTIYNQKGGVGKTTTNINLAACLARLGEKILVIDIDPQANSTSGLGVELGDKDQTIYDYLLDDNIKVVKPLQTKYQNLDIIASEINLSAAEIELAGLDKKEKKLKQLIAKLDSEYDYIFIDCPPSLGLLTINALVAADSIMIPLQSEYYALEGVSNLISTYNLIKKKLNANLRIEGVVLTMYDKRNNLSEQVAAEVERFFKALLYKTRIPRNIKLAEAPSFGQPIINYDITSAGAEKYMQLAREFLRRNNGY